MHIFLHGFMKNYQTGRPGNFFFLEPLLYVAIGVLLTHLMRMFILKFRLLSVKIQRQILYFILLSIFTAFICGYAEQIAFRTLHLNSARELELMKTKVFINIANEYFVVDDVYPELEFLLFNLSLYHLCTARTYSNPTVKIISERTGTQHHQININPHFIFNALNSIRALVNENPDRARDAITELSNILRSSINIKPKLFP